MIKKYLRFLVKNYLFAVIALVFTCVYWWSAKDLPAKSLDFPKALLLILIPLFIWNGVNSVRQFRQTLADKATPEDEKWDCRLHITFPKLLVTGLTLFYMLLIPIFGFLICTVVYLAAVSFYLGIRKPLPLVLFSVLVTGALYAIFAMWLHIRLPSGILF